MIYLFLLIILSIYVLTFKIKKNNVQFLNKETGREIFESAEYKSYEKVFQPREIYYKSNLKINDGDVKKLKQLYIDNIIDFEENEKDFLKKICNKSDDVLIAKFGVTINWRLMCMKDKLDWGYPYTLNNTIILCKKEVVNMLNRGENYTLSYLTHEAVHVLQKDKLESFFFEIYEKLNFVKINVQSILLNDEIIKKNWVTNPDGVNGEWLYKITDGYICPILLLNDSGKHRTVFIKFDNNFKIVNHIEDIKKCNEYNIFNQNHIYQNDHPNELFGSYMQYLVENNEI